MRKNNIHKTLSERFGDPIGSYAGDAPVGVRSVEEAAEFGPCGDCGMLPIDGQCGCKHKSETCSGCGSSPEMCSCQISRLGMYEGLQPCEACGMLEVEGSCGCTHMAEAEGGPSPKTARKILRGTKTFKQKMKKVSGWAEDPAAAAAWMTHKATGKWPSEE